MIVIVLGVTAAIAVVGMQMEFRENEKLREQLQSLGKESHRRGELLRETERAYGSLRRQLTTILETHRWSREAA